MKGRKPRDRTQADLNKWLNLLRGCLAPHLYNACWGGNMLSYLLDPTYDPQLDVGDYFEPMPGQGHFWKAFTATQETVDDLEQRKRVLRANAFDFFLHFSTGHFREVVVRTRISFFQPRTLRTRLSSVVTICRLSFRHALQTLTCHTT